jgi:hypothetical protein
VAKPLGENVHKLASQQVSELAGQRLALGPSVSEF